MSTLVLSLRTHTDVQPDLVHPSVPYALDLEFLSKRIWKHTMVLFTGADFLGDVIIEEYIESEGAALKWLIEKCGNRYHILNNENTDDDTQVKALLDKIEEMVAGNGGCYESHKKIVKKDMKQRVKERAVMVKKQTENHTLRMGDALHLSDVRIVLLGHMGAGKISAGNTILGKDAFDLKSTTQCVKREGEVAGRRVTVVNAPGWWRNYLSEKTSEMTKQILSKKRAAKQHPKIPNVWKHVLLLFTCGDWLGGTTIEQHIESEGDELKRLVNKCGNRYHVLNNKQRDDGAQVKELLEKIEEMVAGNHGKLLQFKKPVVTPEVQQLTSSRRAESYQFFPPNFSAEKRSETSSFRGSQASLGSSSTSSGYESATSDAGSSRFSKISTRKGNLAVVFEDQERFKHQTSTTRRKRTMTE